MKPLLLKRIISGFLLLVGMTAVCAQDFKVGFVDTARVLKEAPQADVARKKLENEFAPRDRKIVEMQTELKKLDEQQKRDIAVMSDINIKKLEREIISLTRDIKRAREEFTEDFNIRRNEELSKLQKLVREVITRVAEDGRYDLILSDSVLYTSKRIDITGSVLDRLREIGKQTTNNSTANE